MKNNDIIFFSLVGGAIFQLLIGYYSVIAFFPVGIAMLFLAKEKRLGNILIITLGYAIGLFLIIGIDFLRLLF